jgi:RNA polymerase II subunit A-like phosphatase
MILRLLNRDDYLTRPEPEPLPGTSNTRQGGGIEMSHDSLGVTVSSNEAKRLENQIKEDLLKSRKLTLIVDLDQTIIHTTVDPTVGEWMAEIERDEVEEKKGVSAIQSGGKEKDGSGAGPSTTPQASPRASSSVEMKEKNPNADALRDVARFTLQDDLPPGYKPPKKAKGKTQSEFDRYYYTKPRWVDTSPLEAVSDACLTDPVFRSSSTR